MSIILPEFPLGTYSPNQEDDDVRRNGLQIRTERSTANPGSRIGAFKGNDVFGVYDVYPEANGIVWARVSSNMSGVIHYCALRVNNHKKVILISAAASESTTPPPPADVLIALAGDVASLKTFLRERFGYKG